MADNILNPEYIHLSSILPMTFDIMDKIWEPKELTPQEVKLYTERSSYSFSSIRTMANYPRISALKFRSIIRKAKQR